ncbi:hypothetical protein CRG98_041561 [Punica granatum]|uniref:Neprosin PEP catalytic domain-containing protein n=1 Tax=Punica granatum TaxID=22663 RepID=A0A2I0I241_PUNGR|nr:hypothetical protein CRG98_041561 [Punica granatum]
MRECLGSQFAVVKIGSGKQTPFAAGQSSINIQQPDLKAGETSGAQIWLDGGDGGSSNLVSAGGSYVNVGSRYFAVPVDPTLYGDSRVYFTAHWKDENTKNWWIAGGDNLTPIGYWPKELFSSLTEGATSLAYGGPAPSCQRGSTVGCWISGSRTLRTVPWHVGTIHADMRLDREPGENPG